MICPCLENHSPEPCDHKANYNWGKLASNPEVAKGSRTPVSGVSWTRYAVDDTPMTNDSTTNGCLFGGILPKKNLLVKPPDDTPLQKMICDLEASPPKNTRQSIGHDPGSFRKKRKKRPPGFSSYHALFNKFLGCVVPRPLGHQTRAGNTTFLFNRKYLDLYLPKAIIEGCKPSATH